MRILIAVHGYPPRFIDGAERRAARTARELARRGHAVAVLSVEAPLPDLPHDATDELLDGVAVRRMLAFEPGTGLDARETYDNARVAEVTRELVARHRPDVLHVFSGYRVSGSALDVARAHRLPFVVSLTDYWWICHRITLVRTDNTLCSGPTLAACTRCHAEYQRRFRAPAQLAPGLAARVWRGALAVPALRRRLGYDVQHDRVETLHAGLQAAAALVAPSQYLADRYVAAGIDPALIHVWRQGVELSACGLREPSDSLRVGYLGQVKPHKGVDLLLDAWAQLRGSRPRTLRIFGSPAGEPDYERRIRARVDEALDVEWPGDLEPEAVWDTLRRLDVIVVPSRWPENSPNVILEAHAVGVPVIAARAGGIPEMVDHDVNGLLFPVDDVASLAAHLQRLLDDQPTLERLRNGPRSFKSVEQEVDELCALYERLIRSPADPHTATGAPAAVSARAALP